MNILEFTSKLGNLAERIGEENILSASYLKISDIYKVLVKDYETFLSVDIDAKEEVVVDNESIYYEKEYDGMTICHIDILDEL